MSDRGNIETNAGRYSVGVTDDRYSHQVRLDVLCWHGEEDHPIILLTPAQARLLASWLNEEAPAE